MNNKYQAIIFDLGRVLIDFDHRIAAKRISRFTDKSPDEIFKLFFDSELTSLFETGKLSPEDFFQKVKEILNLDISYKDFLPIWNEIFFSTPLNEEMREIVKKVKDILPILLLSNINKLHFEYLKSRFSMFENFDKIILSYKVGLRKPDPEIYKLALKSLNSQPQWTLYVEDRLDLVKEAERLGIIGFHFNGKESLEKLRSVLFF